MFNTSFRIIKDGVKAEDIMQESFLTAFTKLEHLKEDAMFGPWLKRIVINNSLAEYRKIKKDKTIPLEEVIYKVEQDYEVLEDPQLTAMKVTQIMEGMNHLQENYQIILTLFLIEGYDYEEISDILKISYGNCRTMVSRAKDSLRRKLTPKIGV